MSTSPDNSDLEAGEAAVVDGPGLDAGIGKGRLFLVGLSSMIVATALAWLVGETVLGIYGPRLYPKLKPVPNLEDARRLTEARIESAGIAFAVLGGLFAMTAGTAGGLARRSWLGRTKGGLAGLLIGGVSASIAAIVMLPLFFERHDPQANTLTFPLLTHGVIWGSIGIAIGLAFAVGLRLGRADWLKGIVGGFAGAVLAAIAYEIIGAVVFPTDKAELPIPGSPLTRALGPALLGVMAISGTILVLTQQPVVPKGTAPASPKA